MINFIIKFFKNLFKKSININIEKEGEIFKLTYNPDCQMDPKELSLNIKDCCESLIKNYKSDIIKVLERYDDSNFNVMVLTSFTTKEGYRANEKNIYSSYHKNIESVNYTMIENNTREKLVEIFERYNIEKIDNFKVKIV